MQVLRSFAAWILLYVTKKRARTSRKIWNYEQKKKKRLNLPFSLVSAIFQGWKYNDGDLDEDTAIQYLNDGTLRRTDFTKLPDGYKKAVDKTKPVDEAISEEQQ